MNLTTVHLHHHTDPSSRNSQAFIDWGETLTFTKFRWDVPLCCCCCSTDSSFVKNVEKTDLISSCSDIYRHVKAGKDAFKCFYGHKYVAIWDVRERNSVEKSAGCVLWCAVKMKSNMAFLKINSTFIYLKKRKHCLHFHLSTERR